MCPDPRGAHTSGQRVFDLSRRCWMLAMLVKVLAIRRYSFDSRPLSYAMPCGPVQCWGGDDSTDSTKVPPYGCQLPARYRYAQTSRISGLACAPGGPWNQSTCLLRIGLQFAALLLPSLSSCHSLASPPWIHCAMGTHDRRSRSSLPCRFKAALLARVLQPTCWRISACLCIPRCPLN